MATKKSFEYRPPVVGEVPTKINTFEPAKSDLPHDQFGNPIKGGSSGPTKGGKFGNPMHAHGHGKGSMGVVMGHMGGKEKSYYGAQGVCSNGHGGAKGHGQAAYSNDYSHYNNMSMGGEIGAVPGQYNQ